MGQGSSSSSSIPNRKEHHLETQVKALTERERVEYYQCLENVVDALKQDTVFKRRIAASCDSHTTARARNLVLQQLQLKGYAPVGCHEGLTDWTVWWTNPTK